MQNLLAETTKMLLSNGKAPEDVRWVGKLAGAYSLRETPAAGSWNDFVHLANFDYNADYGGAQVEMNLVVVGDDWWLERGEYDGSEWWEFKTLPKRPENAAPLRTEDLRED